MSSLIEFRQVFDIFDKDRDGALSLDEVKPILEQMGHTISHSELHRVLEEFDSNREYTTIGPTLCRTCEYLITLLHLFKTLLFQYLGNISFMNSTMLDI